MKAAGVFHRLSNRVHYAVLREVVRRSRGGSALCAGDVMEYVTGLNLGVKLSYVRNVLTGLSRVGLLEWHYQEGDGIGKGQTKWYLPAAGVGEWLAQTEELLGRLEGGEDWGPCA